jgi:hypothetical protein
MKKAKIATIAMILMLGLGACGNNKAGSAESAVSTENAQTVSETGSESSGKLMAGDETYQYVLDRNSGKLTMAGKEAGKTEVPDDFVSTEQSEGNIESSDIIKDVTINEGVERIGIYAFEECKNLKTVIMPESMTEIGQGAFHSCVSLESVTVPENVTVLNEDVFFGCDSLKEVKITGKVTKISDMSFANCNQLESVVIPASVTEIGEGVFTGETTLNVYFGGTEADWNKITIGNDNKALETANIHYESDGE